MKLIHLVLITLLISCSGCSNLMVDYELENKCTSKWVGILYSFPFGREERCYEVDGSEDKTSG